MRGATWSHILMLDCYLFHCWGGVSSNVVRAVLTASFILSWHFMASMVLWHAYLVSLKRVVFICRDSWIYPYSVTRKFTSFPHATKSYIRVYQCYLYTQLHV